MLSEEEVKKIVARAVGEPSVQLLEHKLVAHSADKVGFLGEHRDLEVKFRRSSSPGLEPETRRFFLKSLPHSSARQEAFIRDSGLFLQEVSFFTRLLPELRKSAPADEDWCPRCLHAGEELLVLEDMRARGYAMQPARRLKAEHLEAALRGQARLHAVSLLAEARLGQPLDQLFPEACTERLFARTTLQHHRLEVYVDLAERAARKLAREPDRLGTALGRGFARIYAPGPGAKLARVVCHGDTWPNNYLFDESRRPFGCVLVDFQLVRYAPRAYDLAQLMYLGASRETREREERKALQAYHQELCASLDRNGRGTIESPSFEEVWEEYEDVRLSAMLAYVIYHPILGMSAKALAAYDEDTDKFYEKIMFRTDNEYLWELYDKDEEYFSGLAALTLELIEYCEKHEIPAQEMNDALIVDST